MWIEQNVAFSLPSFTFFFLLHIKNYEEWNVCGREYARQNVCNAERDRENYTKRGEPKETKRVKESNKRPKELIHNVWFHFNTFKWPVRFYNSNAENDE